MPYEIRTSDVVLTKAPSETLKRTIDFKDLGLDTVGGEALTGTPTVVVDPTGELTCTGLSVSGTLVAFTLNSGVLGKTYKLTFAANTTTGQVLYGAGLVSVGTP